MLDSTLICITHHIIGFHYAFEMLLCFLSKLNYFICFECFGLLYNILNLGMRVLVFVFKNFFVIALWNSMEFT